MIFITKHAVHRTTSNFLGGIIFVGFDDLKGARTFELFLYDLTSYYFSLTHMLVALLLVHVPWRKYIMS